MSRIEIDTTEIVNWGKFLDTLTNQAKERVKGNRTDLRALKNGEVFVDPAGDAWVVCEQLSNTTSARTVVARKDVLPHELVFQNADWGNSDRKEYLNGTYYESLKGLFGKENILEHPVSLTALDGTDGYDDPWVYVSELTFDRFQRYQQYIRDYKTVYGLVTPSTTNPEIPAPCVYGCAYGNIQAFTTSDPLAMRPMLTLNANMVVQRNEDHKINTTIEYKGFTGTVEYSEEKQVYFGSVPGSETWLTYEGKTMEKVLQAFHSMIDELLDSHRVR